MTTSDAGPGGIDLRRFNAVFFEECAEHLAEMEQILLSLSDRQPDQEELNAIFRAAHSIKGGAGIFGFEDMTIVTHVMESLLDRIRRNEIPFTPSMVDLFLEAQDVISMQLAGHRDGNCVRQEAVEAVSRKLQQLIDAGAEPQARPAASSPMASPSLAEPQSDDPALRRYRLVFTPDPDIFKRGIRLESMVLELRDLAEPGQFASRAELVDPPRLHDFDPESCLTRWHFTLTTRADREQLLEVFMFVAEEEQLEIHELNSPGAAGSPDAGAADAAGSAGAACFAGFTGAAETSTAASTPAAAGDPASSAAAAHSAGTAPRQELPAPSRAAGEGRRAYDRDETLRGGFGRRQGESDSSIRVSVAKVDQLINQMGELLITQAMLLQVSAGYDPVHHKRLHESLAQLERNSRELQGSIMSIRLVPVGIVFNRFPRMVRDLAARLGKSVELKTVGEATELDKGLIEKIADPLSHLVRNSLDHGIETGEVRAARGKPVTGTIQLKASQQGGRIVIEVSDDGGGLDRGKILAKAAQAGIPHSEGMSDEEVWQLIFAPGFSTADTVTDISGRGVGMDVVLKNVQSIGGRVQVTSQPGRGASISISLPLTLAILNGLSVAVGQEKFVIPLNSVVESLQPKPAQLKTVNGREIVDIRGDYLPIVRLAELFDIEGAVREPQSGILVLVDLEGEKAALMVDALLDELQVVVKSVETNYRKVRGNSGATILGDGRVALILDVQELIAMQKGRQQATAH